MNASLLKPALLCLIFFAGSAALPAPAPVHVWEKLELRSNATGVISLPDFPENIDWGLRLIFE